MDISLQRKLKTLIKQSSWLSSDKKRVWLSRLEELTPSQKMELYQIFVEEQNGAQNIENNYQANLNALGIEYRHLAVDFEKKQLPKALAKRSQQVQKKI